MRTTAITSHKDQTVGLCLKTIQQHKQALVFCASKRAAESQAEKIAKDIRGEEQAINFAATNLLAEKILKVLSTPTKQCKRLSLCIRQGIAFHHAGLASKQRELVEDAFREGIIKIICSTPTLAAGLDMPAFRTIIRDTKRFGNRGMVPIPVLEYEQMAGRAGRPGKEDYGEAILIAKNENDLEELRETYIRGQVEDIFSKLAVEPVLRTYILSLVATKFVTNAQELYSFFEKTFYAQQFSDSKRLQRTLQKMIVLLEEWRFLEQTTIIKQQNKTDTLFIPATRLLEEEKTNENHPLTATLLGQRVSELYLDPLTAHVLLVGLQKLSCNPKESTDEEQTFALIHLLHCSLEMIPLLRAKAIDMEMIQTRRLEQEFLFTEEEFYDVSVDDFDDSIKSTQCMLDWMSERTEDELFERYNVRPGELSIKLQKADWLLYACEELARMSNLKPVIKIIKQVRVRAKHGVKAELLTLLHFKNIGRVRARKLFTHHVKTIKDVERATPEFLEGIVGVKIAQSLKEQVGQKKEDKPLERQEHL
ncbi:hypothetical protein K9M74_05425 [Candidatus Woesearchaeota archaeon]|nr:hypothetical protein [Candidatus Woesearchaeota archaeon]